MFFLLCNALLCMKINDNNASSPPTRAVSDHVPNLVKVSQTAAGLLPFEVFKYSGCLPLPRYVSLFSKILPSCGMV